MQAVGWFDKKLKSIVCNFGTSHRGSDAIRHRVSREIDPQTEQYILLIGIRLL